MSLTVSKPYWVPLIKKMHGGFKIKHLNCIHMQYNSLFKYSKESSLKTLSKGVVHYKTVRVKRYGCNFFCKYKRHFCNITDEQAGEVEVWKLSAGLTEHNPAVCCLIF